TEPVPQSQPRRPEVLLHYFGLHLGLVGGRIGTQVFHTENTDVHQGVKTPFPRALINDFRAALEQAQESDAKVLMMVLFGDDMVRALNLAYEMGLTEKMQIVVPNLTLGMVRQVGPTIMEGVVGGAPWVWNLPYENNYQRGKDFVEAFSDRYEMRPSSSAASAYSIVYQYKEAV